MRRGVLLPTLVEGAASVGIRLVHIQWLDSCSPSDSGWHKPEELTLKSLTCDTVGIIVAEDKKQISVASCIVDSGKDYGVYGVITIPKCSILKRRRVS